ncbi:MAG: amino acid adenylation domain-containing protein [Candidatus Aminicenantes bacterium]|jgi:amino acid adenylation domain-containing protein
MKDNLLQYRLIKTFADFKTRPALESETRQVTYEELDKRSSFIAHQLLKKGVKKESFVGIVVEDRIDLITTIIGIVKAGGVFVPLDPVYPRKRLEQMIHITGTRHIIIDPINSRRLGIDEPGKKETIEYILWEESQGLALPFSLDGRYSPQDRIYIYFTSGTTGQPRAIVGKHEGLLHFIEWEIQTFAIDETFRFSQFTNPGFDVFLRDIFVPLCAGGTICIPGREVKTSAGSLIQWIHQQKINLVHCVPSLFRVFNTNALEPGHFNDLKYILFAGEKVIPQELKNWYDTFYNRIQLVNLYGPTETTLAKVYYLIQPADSERDIMPIGKPISGARAFVMNENLEVCEKFVSGEIHIRTPYHTYGYLNDPQLNREKFIPNPYTHDLGDFLYKTGDLGRLLPDGNIELSGRVDRQVKLQGIRIELDEIENILLKHPQVKEAVVIKRSIEGQNEFLSAFITGTAGPGETKEIENRLLVDTLRQYLEEQLPEQMIPAYIHIIEQLPRKPNGKLDYDEISLQADTVETEYIPPTNDIEEKLVKIWAQLLQKPGSKIGITNSFFQLGGNSLNLMSLIGQIHKFFGKRINLGEIFQNATVEKQAIVIKDALKKDFIPLKPVEEKEYYALSPAQQRLYTLQQMYGENTIYNIFEVHRFDDTPDVERLKEAFAQLIKRHESLRTSFPLKDDEPVQKIWEFDQVDFEIEHCHVSEEAKKEQVFHGFVKPFDLENAPLLRVGLVNVKGTEHFLMVNMHHIISDGTSHDILVHDFIALYSRDKLPGLRLQYKDYSEWLNSRKIKETIKKQEKHWLNRLKGEIPVLDMPTDYKRPAIKGLEGRAIDFGITKQETEALEALAKQEDATLFMVLLALYNIWLSKLSGQSDIPIGAVVAGRNHVNLEQIIGVFVNTLALRNFPKPEKTFRQFLKELKRRTLSAFDNQEYPFDNLVEKVVKNRDISRFPLYDAGFVFQNFPGLVWDRRKPGKTDLNVKRYHYEKETNIGEDLLLFGYFEGEQLSFTLNYYTGLFKKETIARYVGYFKEIVKMVIENPGKKLKEIEIISAQEKEELRTAIKQSQDNIQADFAI